MPEIGPSRRRRRRLTLAASSAPEAQTPQKLASLRARCHHWRCVCGALESAVLACRRGGGGGGVHAGSIDAVGAMLAARRQEIFAAGLVEFDDMEVYLQYAIPSAADFSWGVTVEDVASAMRARPGWYSIYRLGGGVRRACPGVACRPRRPWQRHRISPARRELVYGGLPEGCAARGSSQGQQRGRSSAAADAHGHTPQSARSPLRLLGGWRR